MMHRAKGDADDRALPFHVEVREEGFRRYKEWRITVWSKRNGHTVPGAWATEEEAEQAAKYVRLLFGPAVEWQQDMDKIHRRREEREWAETYHWRSICGLITNLFADEAAEKREEERAERRRERARERRRLKKLQKNSGGFKS